MSFQNLYATNIECSTINGSNVTSPPVYTKIATASSIVPASATNGNRLMNVSGGTAVTSGTSDVNTSVLLIHLNPADFPSTPSKEPKLRLRYIVATNDVDPTSVFTVGLYAVTNSTGTSGQMAITRGSLFSELATVNSPLPNSRYEGLSATSDIPTTGVYCLGISNTGTTSALTMHTVVLELVYEDI